jgi:hypothetical protein
MLTNNEIEGANLFNYEIAFRYAHGYKYLVIDIEELAEKIFATVDDNDKRKQKYLKNVEKNDKKIELIDDMRENINGYLEENDLEPDGDALSFIEQIIRRKYDADLDEVIGYVRRKIKLDNLINERGPKFIKLAKKHYDYDAYIYDHPQSLAETFDEISKDIKQDIILSARKKKMNQFIEEQIDKSFVDFVTSLSIHNRYTTQVTCKIKFETICNRILEHVERKELLDNFIMDNDIDDKYIRFAWNSLSYINYVTNLKCDEDLESVGAAIMTQIKKKIVQDNKKNPPSSGCNWLDATRKKDARINKIYMKYLQKGGDLDIVKKTIQNIMDFSEQKTKNIDLAIDNMGFANVDPKIYEDIKFDYLTGEIKLSDANIALTHLKKYITKI